MPKLVRVSIAAELLNTTEGALMTLASLRKKNNGVYPEWYKADGKLGGSIAYIDIEILQRYQLIQKRAWLYATDKLYWIFDSMEHYNMSDFASIFSNKSSKKESVNSWAMYLSRDMFNIPSDRIYELKEKKIFDFVKHGTRLIYMMKKNINYFERRLLR